MGAVIAGDSSNGGLSAMLEARSVAVIGASARLGTVGNHLIRQLVGGGYEGRIHPINRRYAEIEGLAVAPHISEVGAVDLAVVAVANRVLVDEFEAAVAAGARSLAVFASCHGNTADGEPIVQRLSAIAREAAVPVCGGNGMGFLNLEHRLRICGFHQPWDLETGGVTFLTHSGSLFSAMLHNRRHLRFNLVVSTGNELATTMAAYLNHAVGLASTRAIGLFLETVRNPSAMALALDRAAEADIPVVVLKVGRTERGRSAVATHSAALAGDHGAFEAFARGHRAHLVDTMEELADTLALFAGGRRASTPALGSVHDSGGERTMLIDIADRVGVPLARISPATKERLAGFLDPGLEPENPVDAWGTGRDAGEVLASSALALADDPAVGAILASLDLTQEDNPDESYGPTLLAIARRTTKAMAVLGNVPDAIDPGEARLLADAGIPVLRGLETGLRAVRHLFDHPHRRLFEREPHPATARWIPRLGEARVLGEAESLAMLADFDVPVAPTEPADSEDSAVAAANRIGYPVAIKTTAHLHKSDVGGVHLDLADADQVRSAYRSLSSLGSAVVVQQMASTGIEVAFGAVHDQQFGPVVMVSAGGTLIEVLSDATTSLPELDAAGARAMIERLQMRHLLRGVRGNAPADLDSLTRALVAFAHLVASLRGHLQSVDVNPLVVGASGTVAVDAIAVSR